MSQTLEQLMAIAEAAEDQSEVTSQGDFVYELPVEGVTVGRMIEYVELGKQPQRPYQGKPKPPCEVVRMTFELLSPAKNIKEIEVNGEKKMVAEYITVQLAKKLGEKARFKKLYNKLVYGRPIKHLARCLGDAFVITIVHNEVKGKDGAPDKKYANIEKDGEWLIGAPFALDAITGAKTAYNIPANMHPLKIFLFDNPTQETWDSLYIAGTREVKTGDKVEQVSKNWLQEVILSAVDYPGSKLQLMLGGVAGSDLPMTEKQATEIALNDSLPGDPAGLASGDVAVDPAAVAAKAAAPVDALAALGLS